MQAHVLRGEAAAQPGHQQTARREAGSRRPHHPVARALAQELQPRRDRDRLRDLETIHPAGAGEIRHVLFAQEEETSRYFFASKSGFSPYLSDGFPGGEWGGKRMGAGILALDALVQ